MFLNNNHFLDICVWAMWFTFQLVVKLKASQWNLNTALGACVDLSNYRLTLK